MALETAVKSFDALEEFQFLKNWHERYPRMKSLGYDIVLPKHSIYQKVFEGDASRINWNVLKYVMQKGIHWNHDYSYGLENAKKGMEIFKKLIPFFERLKEKWDFFIPEKYTVCLTLYGAKGSYNPDEGLCMIRLDLEDVADYEICINNPYEWVPNPIYRPSISKLEAARTIVHEFVHIGVQWIVKKYQLSQDEKESLVDYICSEICKGKEFPGKYRWEQSKFRNSVFESMLDSTSIENIPLAVEKYRNAYPIAT